MGANNSKQDSRSATKPSNSKKQGGRSAKISDEFSHSKGKLPWIQRDNLPHQALAIVGRNTRTLTVLDLKSGPTHMRSLISDHKCCGIVTISDKVYAVTQGEILRINHNGSGILLLENNLKWDTEVVSVKNKIYIIQPYNEDMSSFDPDDNGFNRTLPGSGLGEGFCAASSHNYIFAMGGRRSKKSAIKFDPLKNAWTKIASMRTDRLCARAACVDEKIYVAGGVDGRYEPIKSAEFYSPDDDIWTQIPNMNIGRRSFSTCVIGNQLFAIGGSGNKSQYSIEVYNGDNWIISSPGKKGQYTIEVYNRDKWMMVTTFEYGTEDSQIHACIWPDGPLESSKSMDEEYQKLKQNHATITSKSFGKKGGEVEISGCKVRLSPRALREEREITFLARIDQNQKKGLLSITPALECDPPLKLHEAANVTMRTSISANAGETIPVTLFTQKRRQGKWKETEQLSLRERNEVEFKVKECSAMKIATKSREGKFHLISDFYIHSETAMIAAIFSKDEVVQSLTRKQLLERGNHEFGLASHPVLGEIGSEISVSMERKEPLECLLTGGFPSSTFTVDEDYFEKGKQDIYYELEPEPSDQCKKVSMLFGYKVGGEKEQYLPLQSKWPPTKPEKGKKTYNTITAGTYYGPYSQNTTESRGDKNIIIQDCPGAVGGITDL